MKRRQLFFLVVMISIILGAIITTYVATSGGSLRKAMQSAELLGYKAFAAEDLDKDGEKDIVFFAKGNAHPDGLAVVCLLPSGSRPVFNPEIGSFGKLSVSDQGVLMARYGNHGAYISVFFLPDHNGDGALQRCPVVLLEDFSKENSRYCLAILPKDVETSYRALFNFDTDADRTISLSKEEYDAIVHAIMGGDWKVVSFDDMMPLTNNNIEGTNW